MSKIINIINIELLIKEIINSNKDREYANIYDKPPVEMSDSTYSLLLSNDFLPYVDTIAGIKIKMNNDLKFLEIKIN